MRPPHSRPARLAHDKEGDILRPSVRRLAALAGMFWLLTPAIAHAASEPSGFLPFAPDSIWNLPVRSDAPLNPNSASYVSALQQSVTTNGSWLNTSSCGMPEYWADPNTPTVSVTLNHPSYEDPALIRAWSTVPMPANAKPANCSDKNFAVLQQQPNGSIKEWEFWMASQSASGAWTAGWGGVINNVLTDRGVASPYQWTDPTGPTASSRQSNTGWNVTASSISMLAGVITNSDLASGQINHAVAMAVSAAAAGQWMWPAQRDDGSSTAPYALPEGAHLRLNPALNIASLHLTPLMAMIARAAQTYGIVVRDQTWSANVFYAEQPPAGQSSPVSGLLGGVSLTKALAAFPWSQLQLLNAPICTTWGICAATPQATISVNGNLTVGSTVTLDTSNSVLNFPRTQVAWDLTGSGVYITPGGSSVSTTLILTTPGVHTVGVQITTEDGTTVTGTTTFTVAAQSGTAKSRADATASTSAPAAASAPIATSDPNITAAESSLVATSSVAAAASDPDITAAESSLIATTTSSVAAAAKHASVSGSSVRTSSAPTTAHAHAASRRRVKKTKVRRRRHTRSPKSAKR
jgi:hypothetical protein